VPCSAGAVAGWQQQLANSQGRYGDCLMAVDCPCLESCSYCYYRLPYRFSDNTAVPLALAVVFLFSSCSRCCCPCCFCCGFSVFQLYLPLLLLSCDCCPSICCVPSHLLLSPFHGCCPVVLIDMSVGRLPYMLLLLLLSLIIGYLYKLTSHTHCQSVQDSGTISVLTTVWHFWSAGAATGVYITACPYLT
jgi:hypothetical protein